LSSLDDIQCIQEALPDTPQTVLPLLDDEQLCKLLEVSICIYLIIVTFLNISLIKNNKILKKKIF